MTFRPEPAERFFRLLRDAFKLEFQTTAGQVNFFGMLLVIAGTVALAALRSVEEIVRVIAAAMSGQSLAQPSDPLLLAIIFVVLLVTCMLLLWLIDGPRKADMQEVDDD